MTRDDTYFLREVANRLEKLANRLAANEKPGQIDYISKRHAAKVSYSVCVDLRRTFPLET